MKRQPIKGWMLPSPICCEDGLPYDPHKEEVVNKTLKEIRSGANLMSSEGSKKDPRHRTKQSGLIH